jgi:hypothetical protein
MYSSFGVIKLNSLQFLLDNIYSLLERVED